MHFLQFVLIKFIAIIELSFICHISITSAYMIRAMSRLTK